MKHSQTSSISHLKDSQYLWHFLDIHEQPFSQYTKYKSILTEDIENSAKDFQTKYDIDVLPYLFTAFYTNPNTFHRFILYLKRYIDLQDNIQNDVANDIFVLNLLERSEPFEIIIILIAFQYFFL